MPAVRAVFPAEQVAEVKALACELPATHGLPLGRFSRVELHRLVRADSGGATHAFLDHVAARGVCFSVGFDLTEPVREAVLALPEQAWRPALSLSGEPKDGAAVAELALDLEANGWPAGTRAICRRERPHPGAQLSFTDANGYRFQVFITNQQGGRIDRLEQLHRQHAVVEDRIRCGKHTGL